MEIDQNYIIEYTKRANDIISRYSKYKDIVKNGDVQIAEVNNALADYISINSFLLEEYEKKILLYNLKKDNFDNWFAEKFIDIRNKNNTDNKATTKWLSKQEIEMIIRIDYKEEFSEKNGELILLDREVSTLRRLCETYKKMDTIFQTLSNNARQEMKSLSLENRMNTIHNEENNSNNYINKERTRDNLVRRN